MPKFDGLYLKEITKLEHQQRLILDDFGMQSLDAQRDAILDRIVHGAH